MLSQSSSALKNVKDGNFRYHDMLGDAGGVSFALRRGNFMQISLYIATVTKLGGRSKTRCRCSPLLVSRCFHDVSSSHSVPINVATVIRTRHCRLQRSCIEDIEGCSGSVGFKAANTKFITNLCGTHMSSSTRKYSYTIHGIPWYTLLSHVMPCLNIWHWYHMPYVLHVAPCDAHPRAFVCSTGKRAFSET